MKLDFKKLCFFFKIISKNNCSLENYHSKKSNLTMAPKPFFTPGTLKKLTKNFAASSIKRRPFFSLCLDTKNKSAFESKQKPLKREFLL